MEKGTIKIDIDGQLYKLNYEIGEQAVKAVMHLIDKPIYKIAKRLSKALVRESCRVRRDKNVK